MEILAFKNPRRRTGAQTMTACHFGFSLWFQIIKPWSCCPAEAYCFLMTCCDTNINCSGCFYVKPRVEGMESGDCSQICLMCVWNERGRVNKREMKRGREGGKLFSGHAKEEEAAALVTWHTLISGSMADTPMPSKYQQQVSVST